MSTAASQEERLLPATGETPSLWAPGRGWTTALFLIAGVGTIATSFAALPVVWFAVLVGAWCAAVVLFSQQARGPAGFTVLSICVKSATLFVIGLLVFDPTSAIGVANGLYWIPLGLLNMASGLWFLKVIRGKAS